MELEIRLPTVNLRDAVSYAFQQPDLSFLTNEGALPLSSEL